MLSDGTDRRCDSESHFVCDAQNNILYLLFYSCNISDRVGYSRAYDVSMCLCNYCHCHRWETNVLNSSCMRSRKAGFGFHSWFVHCSRLDCSHVPPGSFWCTPQLMLNQHTATMGHLYRCSNRFSWRVVTSEGYPREYSFNCKLMVKVFHFCSVHEHGYSYIMYPQWINIRDHILTSKSCQLNGVLTDITLLLCTYSTSTIREDSTVAWPLWVFTLIAQTIFKKQITFQMNSQKAMWESHQKDHSPKKIYIKNYFCLWVNGMIAK